MLVSSIALPLKLTPFIERVQLSATGLQLPIQFAIVLLIATVTVEPSVTVMR
jgi:hypothetical protein